GVLPGPSKLPRRPRLPGRGLVDGLEPLEEPERPGERVVGPRDVGVPDRPDLPAQLAADDQQGAVPAPELGDALAPFVRVLAVLRTLRRVVAVRRERRLELCQKPG